MENTMTGYPHIDRPWLKYYSDEAKYHLNAPESTLYRAVYNANKDAMTYPAINYYGATWTYGDMFDEIEKAARSFAALGVQKGDTVVLCLLNMPETVFAFYALNKIGAIVNMVDLRSDSKTMKHYIEQVHAKTIVTLDMAYPLIRTATEDLDIDHIVVVSLARSMPEPIKGGYIIQSKATMPEIAYDLTTLSWDVFMAMGKYGIYTEAPYEPNACAVHMHTGGTTGMPKTVMLSTYGINHVVRQYWFIGIPLDPHNGQTFYNDLPPFILYGLLVGIQMSFIHGETVILLPKFDPFAFPELFAKFRPSHACAVTEHFRQLIKSEYTQDLDMSFLVSLAIGGDAIPQEEEEAINKFIRDRGCRYDMLKGYGMTELSAPFATSTQTVGAIGSVGMPLVENNMKILDADTHEPLKYNQMGELWVTGPGVMLGYFEDPEATEEIMETDENGVRWLKTGDIAHVNEDGLLFIDGRIRRIYMTMHDDQGAKIFPFVPEKTIRESEDVDTCSVVGRKMGDSAFYEPVAFVVKAGDKSEAEIEADLRARCEKEVPSYMQPVEYFFISAIPLTHAGKVDFRQLEEMAENE